MTVQAKKYQIIEQITHIEDEQLLDQLYHLLEANQSNPSILNSLIKPMREKLDIEQLKIEQHYQGFDEKEVERLIKEADIQEPIEELLSMI